MAYQRVQHSGGAVPTTLAGDITSGDTSLNLVSASGWPDGSIGPFYIVIDPGLANEEKILATSRTSFTLNALERGVDGTSASSHAGGATIQHCFTAVEADEANVAANKTIGQVTTKGDLLAATGNQALGRFAAGADGTVVQYDSSTGTGLKSGKITAANITDGTITTTQIADGTIATVDLADAAVTSAKIADANVSAAKLAADAVTTAAILNGAVTLPKLTGAIHAGSVTGNTDGSGNFVIAHGAPFTPSFIFLQLIAPSSGANAGYPVMTGGITSANFNGRMIGVAGSMALLAITIQWLCIA